MGEQGFDEQFNDGLFMTSRHITRRSRPAKWPKSVSEMRAGTTFEAQGLSSQHEENRNSYIGKRPYYAGAQPVSVTKMRRHTDARGHEPQRNVVSDTHYSDRVMAKGKPSQPYGQQPKTYHQQPQFWKPAWDDASLPRNTGVWHGYIGKAYYDGLTKTWRWLHEGSGR